MSMFLHHPPLKVIASFWKLILFAGIVTALVVCAVTVLFPRQYRADAQVLIISQSRYGVDPYTAAKSAERVGENLIQVMKTNDFYQKVIAQSGRQLDLSKFDELSERAKRKLWQKTLDTSVVYGSSVLNVGIYNTNKEQAKEWAGAVVDTLSSKGWEYVGGDVIIKTVNDPVSTNFKVRPNLLLNMFLGLVVGVLGMGVMVLKKEKVV